MKIYKLRPESNLNNQGIESIMLWTHNSHYLYPEKEHTLWIHAHGCDPWNYSEIWWEELSSKEYEELIIEEPHFPCVKHVERFADLDI